MFFLIVSLLCANFLYSAECGDVKRSYAEIMAEKRPQAIIPKMRARSASLEEPTPRPQVVKNILFVPSKSKLDLITAAAEDDTTVLKKLLASGEDPNIRGDEGITPLITAARRNNVPALKLLLAYNADLAAQNDDALTALQVARKWDKHDAVQLLEEAEKAVKEAKDKVELLVRAVINDDSKTVHQLIAQKVDANSIYNDDPVLLYAATYGHPEIVKILLDAGADPAARGQHGDTALMRAADKTSVMFLVGRIPKYIDVLKTLLNSGTMSVDLINARNEQGENALQLAYPNITALELLIKAGADPDAKTSFNEYLFEWAFEHKRQEIQKLLEANSKHYQLVSAAKAGDLKGMEALLTQNVPVNIDVLGITPLIAATDAGQKEAVQFLLKRGADINQQGIYGYTPLMFAAENGSKDLVKILLKNKANPLIENQEYRKAVELAHDAENQLHNELPDWNKRKAEYAFILADLQKAQKAFETNEAANKD